MSQSTYTFQQELYRTLWDFESLTRERVKPNNVTKASIEKIGKKELSSYCWTVKRSPGRL